LHHCVVIRADISRNKNVVLYKESVFFFFACINSPTLGERLRLISGFCSLSSGIISFIVQVGNFMILSWRMRVFFLDLITNHVVLSLKGGEKFGPSKRKMSGVDSVPIT
jgi:hypothetical protein